MHDQVIAAIITGGAAIIAALIGLLRWRGRSNRAARQAVVRGDTPPIFTAARAFATFTTQAEQQRAIQPIEVAMIHGAATLSTSQIVQCAGSSWELDRIGLYLFEEYNPQPNMVQRALHVRHELELIKALPNPRNLLPLHYAVRSLWALTVQQPQQCAKLPDCADLLHELARTMPRYSYLAHSDDIQRRAKQLINLTLRAAA